METAVANAKAEAEWPDGKDELLGRLVIRRGTGKSSAAGRLRGRSRLATRLAEKLAPPIAASPLSPARLVAPLRTVSRAAMANQSLLWSATRPSRRKKASAGVGGSSPLRRTSAASTRPTRWYQRRMRAITGQR